MGGHLARTKKNASAIRTSMKMVGAGFKAASAGLSAAAKAEELKLQQGAEQLTGGAATTATDGATTTAKSADDHEGDRTSSNKNDPDLMKQQAETAELMEQTVDDSLPAFLEFAWAINKRDIQSTLKDVCRKLFLDASVPKEVRLERAEAIRILGREFHSIGTMTAKVNRKAANAKKGSSGETDHTGGGGGGSGRTDFDPEDIKARMSVAAMTTMAKAQGQEVTEEDQQEMIKQAKQMSMAGSSVEEVFAEEGGEKDPSPL